MRLKPGLEHPFDVSPEEAANIQRRLAALRSTRPLPGWVRTITGAYALFLGETYNHRLQIAAAAVTMTLPELETVEAQKAGPTDTSAYRPGFFAFSAGPVLIETLESLSVESDVLLFAAHGTAHPQRFGLAAHLGVLFDRASIGCADSLLVGQARDCRQHRGAWAPVELEGEVVGAALRTQDDANPVFVSPGHKMNLARAIDIVLRCCTQYRTPEPLRHARSLIRQWRAARGQQ